MHWYFESRPIGPRRFRLTESTHGSVLIVEGATLIGRTVLLNLIEKVVTVLSRGAQSAGLLVGLVALIELVALLIEGAH